MPGDDRCILELQLLFTSTLPFHGGRFKLTGKQIILFSGRRETVYCHHFFPCVAQTLHKLHRSDFKLLGSFYWPIARNPERRKEKLWPYILHASLTPVMANLFRWFWDYLLWLFWYEQP
jgi:hypothetical protein